MASNVCDNCALGMFNTKCKCLHGVGNPMSGMMIVVPNVDYNAYKNRGMTFSKYVEIVKLLAALPRSIIFLILLTLISANVCSIHLRAIYSFTGQRSSSLHDRGTYRV